MLSYGLNCYRHPDLESVGICVDCGRSVCQICAVILGGKQYCKTCADLVFGDRLAIDSLHTKPRSTTIVVGSGLVFLESAGSIVVGLALIGLGLLLGTNAKAVTPFQAVFPGAAKSLGAGVTSLVSLMMGGLLLPVAVVGIVSGLWLLRSKKGGALLAIGPVVVSDILAVLSYYLARAVITAEIGALVVAFNAVLAALIVVGWNSLE